MMEEEEEYVRGPHFNSLHWNTRDLEKFIKMGITYCREEIQFKLLIKPEKDNFKIYIKSLLTINRKWTLNHIGIAFFDKSHWSYKEIRGIINTLYLLGYGYHGHGVKIKKILDWQHRFGIDRTRRKLLDLDLFLLECMNEVLSKEGITLDDYEKEKDRIVKEQTKVYNEKNSPERLKRLRQETKKRKKKQKKEREKQVKKNKKERREKKLLKKGGWVKLTGSPKRLKEAGKNISEVIEKLKG